MFTLKKVNDHYYLYSKHGFITFSYQTETGQGQIWTISVKQSQCGKGYGRQLFAECLRILVEQNIHTLQLAILGGSSNVQMMSLIKNLTIQSIDDTENLYILKISDK